MFTSQQSLEDIIFPGLSGILACESQNQEAKSGLQSNWPWVDVDRMCQVVWNSKMREEVLEQMEAARENPEAAGTPHDFHFKALQVQCATRHTLDNDSERSLLLSLRSCKRMKRYGAERHSVICAEAPHVCTKVNGLHRFWSRQ